LIKSLITKIWSLRGIAAVFFGSVSLSLWAFRETPRGLVSHGIPLAGDGVLIGTLIRIVRDESYVNLITGLQSHHYGWPNFLDFRYWPLGILLELTTLKGFSGISGIKDPVVLLHVFSVSKSLPIALAGYFFYRKLLTSKIGSAVLAITFSLVSFNLVRAEGHFVLGFTWSIPLVLGICISIWRLDDVIGALYSSRVSVGHFLAGMACGLSAFYFAIFNGLLAGLVTIAVFARRSRLTFSGDGKISVSRVRPQLRVFCLPLGIVVGLFTQLWPTLLQGRLKPAVVPAVARSWIEPIIYSGSTESFFYDLHALIFRLLGRQDVIAFLDTRTVWEGRQVGAVVGILVYLLIVVVAFAIAFRFVVGRPLLQVSFSVDARWLAVLFCIVTSLYFASGINFVFSRTVLTTIRAWGRLSPYLMLLLVGFCFAVIAQTKQKRLLAALLVSLVGTIQLLEIRDYRSARPPAAVLASAYSEDRRLYMETLQSIESLLPAGCGIAQLPIYPFPEFDRSDDGNIDYAHFQLPLHDHGIYRWSYGAVKNTPEADVYLPLTLQVPPFSRPGLGVQVNSYRESRPCGYSIDSSLLTEPEQVELESLKGSLPSTCLRGLAGAKFKSEPRYFLLLQNDVRCRQPFIDDDYVQVQNGASHSIVWQYLGVEVAEWLSNMPLTSTSNPISVAYSNAKDADIVAMVRLKAGLVTESSQNDEIQLCYRQSDTESCTKIKTQSTRVQKLDLLGLERSGTVMFTIRSSTLKNEGLWSVILGTDMP